MTTRRWTAWLVAVSAAIAACGHSASHSPVLLDDGALKLADGQVVITGTDGSEARVASDGALTVGGAVVPVTDRQRSRLLDYYGAARGLYAHAASTGLAGAEVGLSAVTGVAAGIAKGDMSDLKDKIEAQAGEVKREALKICDSLGELRAAQDQIVGEIAAFRPYAVVTARQSSDCGKDLQQGPGR